MNCTSAKHSQILHRLLHHKQTVMTSLQLWQISTKVNTAVLLGVLPTLCTAACVVVKLTLTCTYANAGSSQRGNVSKSTAVLADAKTNAVHAQANRYHAPL